MRLENISAGGLFAGLLALAGILFVLQRLRVRHRELPVVTTLFWKEAVEEARARVLVKRFRHPLAYLLVLGIASLLWFAAAGPRGTSGGDREVVVLLDGSAGMTRGTRFADTVELVGSSLERLPRDRRQVILCGARSTTLLARGEDPLMFEQRSADLRPEVVPATVEDTLFALADTELGSLATTVYVAGDASIGPESLALLPETMEVVRLEDPDAGELEGNRGITALGVSEAASGAWNRVDVLVELAGTDGAVDEGLIVTLGDGSPGVAGVREVQGDRTRIHYRDLPANGELFSVALSDDALPADDRAAIVLPERPLIRVAVSGSVEPAILAVLEADPAVLVTTERPDVAVRRSGEPLGAGLPALELVADESQAESFVLEHDVGGDSLEVLLDAVAQLGLSEIDATGLAQETSRAISVGALSADVRGIDVWQSLFSSEYNFTQSRSFPLFIAESVRWLAGSTEFESFAAVGTPLGAGRWTGPDGVAHDTVAASFVPARTGEYRSEAGARVVVPLTSAIVTQGLANHGLESAAFAGAGGGPGVVTWIVLLAFFLLLVEWVLYRSGRMP